MSVAETNRFVSSQLLRSCGGSVGWPRAGRTAGRSLSGTGLMARPCVEALRPITPLSATVRRTRTFLSENASDHSTGQGPPRNQAQYGAGERAQGTTHDREEAEPAILRES